MNSHQTLAACFFWFTSVCAMSGAEVAPGFQVARPVWPEGREVERNVFVEFRSTLSPPPNTAVSLRITGASLYRVLVNGQFTGHGPARAGHGFYRLDEMDLSPKLRPGSNELTIEVAGYNANSFYLLDQPSFLQAEIVAAGRIVAATGGEGFQVRIRHDRVQKVQRYSYQRPFSEIWRLPGPTVETARCSIVGAKPLAARGVPFPEYVVRRPVAHVAAGTVERRELPAKPWRDRSLTGVGPTLAGFPEAELAAVPSIELQTVRTATSAPTTGTGPFVLKQNSYRTVDLGVNLSGFIGLRIVARTKLRLFAVFDEILTDGDVDFKRLDCVNIVAYELEPGTHAVESFEPYTLRYLKLIALEGEGEVTDCFLRELANPEAGRATFTSSDRRINRIFEAARETFRQNATDLFMDCPSRERAGWLCDSFFTARVAADLCGNTSVERNFLENYQRPEKFPFLPEGMLPMCYPSDHPNGQFIPNWAMWFVVQLEEYALRSGDRDLVAALRPRVLKLIEYFRRYENADGLLEKLPSWVFVEWSKANSFVQDVNYPSNMLYAGMLDAAGRTYGLAELAAKAARIRDLVRRQSFDGEFFVDNAVRKGGVLQVTKNRTEVCQYFAFFFEVATPSSHPELWRRLSTEFGPGRKHTQAFPDVHPANAFIGNQLRFELLSRDGRAQQILDEAIDYWLYMADRTGTLWEHDAPTASCNHGFASHAAHVLLRDVLGVSKVDTVGKSILLRFSKVSLEWCEGSIPTPDGPIEVRWKKAPDRLVYRLKLPEGYKSQVENHSGLTLERN